MSAALIPSTMAAAGQVHKGVNTVGLTVLIAIFLLVTVMGFLASRWRRPDNVESLEEWGLGGRSFGTWITWFLLGGDLYTAYTFVAVPAAMFATGSVAGFFAVPYTIIVYPIIFFFMSRMWSVSHRHGYVTPADFVRGRYDSRSLSLAVAMTGFLATMPYIALQLVGMQAVLEVAGLGGGGNWLAKDAPLLVAFAVLAAYTYSAGLRAPAIIAFVKDILIYLVIIVAIIYLPHKVGGWDHIFSATQEKMAKPGVNAAKHPTGKPTGSFIPSAKQNWAYATLALGSALALFMYPHTMTATLSSKSRATIRKNASILPAYSLVLAFLALLGWIAIAAGTKPIGLDGKPNAQLVVPQLFEDMFPSWFAGVAWAAIAVGALVPAAIMSIAAANTFTRNVYKEFIKPDASEAQEAKVSKLVSLIVKIFAVAFVLFLDKQNALNFQLLGGIWILQTLPAIVIGLYTRFMHRYALLLGWACGMAYGTYKAYDTINPLNGKHFGGSTNTIPMLGEVGYIGLTALVINLIVGIVATLAFDALKVPAGTDATVKADYFADADDPRIVKDYDPMSFHTESDVPAGGHGLGPRSGTAESGATRA